ncbi:TldD/PmbA family protein [Allobaculum mucilyticum]|uniref:TldD/PmbA family protein n=1 Tax=Allobaculum mucilyticum TaxID=2834459 RepID=UPI001E32706B|nr:metallopeptidase TldD-related protein [Allobaculum mucilyticum]UNT95116.1 TldD/PmbA family protein [Allobaculum mucilyticum]
MNKQAWISRAKELGIEGLEITERRSQSRELNWYEGEMDSFTTSRVLSVSLRALCGGKIVSTSLEKVSDEQMDEILGQLVSSAEKISETEKDILVGPAAAEEVHSSRKWVEPSANQIKTVLASIEKKLLAADERITKVNDLGFGGVRAFRELTNSLGTEISDDYEYQLISASITMRADGEIYDDYLYEIVENLDDFDEDDFVKRLVEKAAAQVGAKSIASRSCKVIFDYKAMSTLFSCFAGMFYGSLIAKGISPLTGRLGEKIFSDKITVIDDPRNLDALFMQNYDDEGTPTATKTVVRDGVFEMMLHNTKSALKMGAESTGNGFASGAGSTDVSSLNLYIQPGSISFDSLLEKMDNGVVISELAGMHAGIDFVSTNFSLQAKGYLVENGKKVRPLTLITVAGNFMDLMNHVEAVASDLNWETRSTAAPSILFEEAAIGGNE